MVITAISTRQPPQAPSTPVVAQQALNDLVNYYRELAQYHRSSVDYHRQLLEQHSQEALTRVGFLQSGRIRES